LLITILLSALWFYRDVNLGFGILNYNQKLFYVRCLGFSAGLDSWSHCQTYDTGFTLATFSSSDEQFMHRMRRSVLVCCCFNSELWSWDQTQLLQFVLDL